ncbi:MAG: hypothetical protein O3B83_03785 [Bacteroidetes bacterium]|jgi:hypothetical protein|nr:hypothetical protein [Bacteroidota bacterium]
MRILAQIAAYLLHPIFIPVYLIVFLMDAEPVMSLYFDGDMKWRFVLALLVNVVAGPILSMWFLKRAGKISSLMMPELKGRSLAFLVTMAWYLLTYTLVQKIGLPNVTKALFIGLILTLGVLALVSLKHKTSAHLAALGGVLGVVIWMFMFYGLWLMAWFMFLIMITALQASFRLYLNAHTPGEVLSGWMIGLICTFGSLYVMVH